MIKAMLYKLSPVMLILLLMSALTNAISISRMRAVKSENRTLKQELDNIARANESLAKQNDKLMSDIRSISESYVRVRTECDRTIQSLIRLRQLKPKPTTVKPGSRYDQIDCSTDDICSSLNSMFQDHIR